MFGKRSIWLSAVALAACALPASAQINNGGFELAPTAPPTAGDWQYNGAGAGRDGSNVHSGSFSANLDNVTQGSNANVLQQTDAGTITPGTTYVLKYWAQGSYGVGGIGQAQLSFMNAGAGILPGSPTFINIPASAGYVQYSQTFTAPANASRLFLAFNAVTGAVQGSTSHLYVDDVSFSIVPEPATLSVLAASGSLLFRRRRA